MRNLIVFFFFFFYLISFSQEISGTIIDFDSSEKLPYANITFLKVNKGNYSKEDGSFKLTLPNKDLITDSLLISFVGYPSKKISVKSLLNNHRTIKLKKDNQVLDEVILNVKKAKYSSTKSLSVKHKGLYASSEPFGNETITFIENEKNKKGKITNVELNFKANKRENIKTYKAYFRVKFYELDSITKAPGKLLSYDDIIIKPENKTQKVKVDLEDNFILFPKNGVFVGLEVIKPSSVTVNSSMYVVAPAITKSHTETPLSWYRYRGKNWFLNDRKSPFKKKFYTSNYVSIDVKYIK